MDWMSNIIRDFIKVVRESIVRLSTGAQNLVGTWDSAHSTETARQIILRKVNAELQACKTSTAPVGVAEDFGLMVQCLQEQLGAVAAEDMNNLGVASAPGLTETDLENEPEASLAQVKTVCQKMKKCWGLQQLQTQLELKQAKQKEDEKWANFVNGTRKQPVPASSPQWNIVVNQWLADRQVLVQDAYTKATQAAEMGRQAREAAAKAHHDAKERRNALKTLDEESTLLSAHTHQTLPDFQQNHAIAELMVAQMVQSGNLNVAQLSQALLGGDHVWVWVEDTGRWSSHPAEVQKCGSTTNPVVLYKQQHWAEAEARYLLWKYAPGDQKENFRSFTANVGPKLFAQQTGSSYTLDVVAMSQKNIQSTYERPIRRVALGADLAQLSSADAQQFNSGLQQQRLIAAQEAKAASEAAAQEFELAARRESQANFALRRAQVLDEGLNPSVWTVQFPNSQPIGVAGIPMAWDPMGDSLYTAVGLPPSSFEHQQVRAFFSKSNSIPITAIERIQNLPLWHLYEQGRILVSAKPHNDGDANEEMFWHGAKHPGITDKVLQSGFDALFGLSTPKGIWLSTNSNYSAGYCRVEGGRRRMFLVRAILGYIGVDSLHCGSTSTAHVRRDDQVGGGSDNRYVLPDDTHVYPAYIVHF